MDHVQLTIKNTIRKRLNIQRKTLSIQTKTKLSQQICDKILSSLIFQQSKSIATYMSVNNEVDLSELFNYSKIFVLPVIQTNQTMTFNLYQNNESLIKNKFGILEPKESKYIDPQTIDLCLMPLVGFKRNGDRLGMGGGFYDKYFALNQMQRKPTILAGIAYDFQEDDIIQTDQWDIPLDIIFTNKEVINCG